MLVSFYLSTCDGGIRTKFLKFGYGLKVEFSSGTANLSIKSERGMVGTVMFHSGQTQTSVDS